MGRVDRALTNGFRKLGYIVAIYPKYFLLGSTIVALTLTTGLLQLNYDSDVQRLFSNVKGRSVYEKAQITKYFPANYSGAFSPSRITNIGRLARIIITVKDEGSIFRTEIWKEIAELDSIIHNVQASYEGISYNYSSLCAKVTDNCYENDHLDLGQVMDSIENGSLRLAYPIMVNPETYNTHVLDLYFAGLNISDDNMTLLSAEALNINYFLKFETEEDDEKGKLWERGVIEALEGMVSDWKYISVYQLTYYSMIAEQEDNTLKVLPYFSVTIFLMCCFTVCTALSRDWVKAKPWVAMFGIFVATLGSTSGFGLLCYVGVSCIGINLAVPFIMLGIGIDDTFVMLSVWRQTNPLDSVPKRLADSYAEAAVSITITSLTDMLSFYVGLLTPIPSIQIFCAYAGTSVFCIYLLQVFCLGAILAISGEQEAGTRHSVFWWIQAVPQFSADGKPPGKNSLTVENGNPELHNASENRESAVMVFFRDRFAKFIVKRWVQAIVLIAFVGYLGVATFGLMHLTEGLKEERLYHDDSYLASYYRADAKYFKRYSSKIQIAITTPLDYSSIETQDRVAEILDVLTNSSRFMSLNYGENWLTGFKSYVSRSAEILKYNISTERQFIYVLRNEYFQNNVYEQDVVFNANRTKIIASRFVMQAVDTFTTEDLKEAVVALRRVAAAQRDVEVVIFNPWFGFVDQYTVIRPLTIQLLTIAAPLVMAVTIVLIPNFVTSICVFLTIVSTELGVLGLMALWGVSLDMISIVCLVMCIGFSVDFSAHISYTYISAEGTPEQRIQKALFSLGLPILQGGGSTIIGVFALYFISSYIYQVFFKVVFLVIVCAAWHGLLVLPVLLLLIRPESIGNKLCGRQKEFKVHT